MPLLSPAARTVPPEMVIVPSASSGWLSAVLADQTLTVPPEMVSVPLESKPSPDEVYQKMRGLSMEEVKRTNGKIDFEDVLLSERGV